MTWEAKDYVGLYGAILSTSVFIWNVAAWNINRGRIKFEVRETTHYDPGTYALDVYIEYKVINKGEKPVTISGLGYTVKIDGMDQKGHGTFLMDNLPHRLDGHSSFLHYRKTPDLFAPKAHLESLFVEDALGKRYKVKRKVVRKLLEKYKIEAVTNHERPS